MAINLVVKVRYEDAVFKALGVEQNRFLLSTLAPCSTATRTTVQPYKNYQMSTIDLTIETKD